MNVGVIYACLLALGVVYALAAGALGWMSDLGGHDIGIGAGGHLDAGHFHPVSGTTIELHWSDNSTGETGFRIERAGPTGPFTQIGTVGANVIASGDLPCP